MGRQLIEKMKQLLIVDSHKFVLDPLIKYNKTMWNHEIHCGCF